MWRLKIGEGADDPYLFSTNNFLGRQTWEFDPHAGTLQERAEVEEARQNYRKNRFQVKPSRDLLWKMQVRTYVDVLLESCMMRKGKLSSILFNVTKRKKEKTLLIEKRKTLLFFVGSFLYNLVFS